MTDPADLDRLIREAVRARLEADPQKMFTSRELIDDVARSAGPDAGNLSEAAVKDVLRSMWGSGVEPKTPGGEYWGQGWSNPRQERP